MKQTRHFNILIVALGALLVSGCLTGPSPEPQASQPPADDFQTVVDSMINDRNNWVDPPRRSFFF
jgi:hypothetical protein